MTGNFTRRLDRLPKIKPRREAYEAAEARLAARWKLAHYGHAGKAMLFFMGEVQADQYQEVVNDARNLLKGDSARRWAADQTIVELFLGGRAKARVGWFWGRNERQIRNHYAAMLLAESGEPRIPMSQFEVLAAS